MAGAESGSRSAGQDHQKAVVRVLRLPVHARMELDLRESTVAKQRLILLIGISLGGGTVPGRDRSVRVDDEPPLLRGVLARVPGALAEAQMGPIREETRIRRVPGGLLLSDLPNRR